MVDPETAPGSVHSPPIAPVKIARYGGVYLMMSPRSLPPILVAALLACAKGAGSGGRESATAANITTVQVPQPDEATTEQVSPTTSAGAAPAPDPAKPSSVKFDLPLADLAAPKPDLPAPTGCHAVDVLFVLDNSSTIAAEQATLAASAAEWMANLMGDLAGTVETWHFGVVTTDAYQHNPVGCQQLGAMVTQTGGADSSMGVCALGGGTFATHSDDPAEFFGCAGLPGTSGDDNEVPIAALQATLAGVGECNFGFVRDDALLVVVLLSDEDDQHEIDGCAAEPAPGTPGDPPSWFVDVATRKGSEGNAVILSIIGPKEDPCPPLDQCNGGLAGAEVATRLLHFTSLFSWHDIERVCAPTYDPFLDGSISLIDAACASFVAP